LPPIYLPDRWEIDYPLRNIMRLGPWGIRILSGERTFQWSPRKEPLLGLRARILIETIRHALALGRVFKKVAGKNLVWDTRYEPLDEMGDVADTWCSWLGIDRTQMEDYAVGELLLNIANYVGFPIGYDYPPPDCEFAMSTVFHVDYVPDDLALVYEQPEGGPTSVQLNGIELSEKPVPTFVWDASNRAVPIARLVRKGENTLRLQWRQPRFPSLFPSVHGIEPVCLTGTFWMSKGRVTEQKYRVPTLPWADIGLPHYIGAITYKNSFDLPLNYMGQRLFLKLDRIGSAADVQVNGKHAGVILWRPYVLDVTDLLAAGENTIEVTVANTAANLLGTPVPAGLIGRPYIVPYWRHRIRFGE
jgi:hypothetical protein